MGQNRADASSISPLLAQLRHVMACLLGKCQSIFITKYCATWPGYHFKDVILPAWEFTLTGKRKKDVTLLLMHWSYVFLALTHQYYEYKMVPCPYYHYNGDAYTEKDNLYIEIYYIEKMEQIKGINGLVQDCYILILEILQWNWKCCSLALSHCYIQWWFICNLWQVFSKWFFGSCIFSSIISMPVLMDISYLQLCSYSRNPL